MTKVYDFSVFDMKEHNFAFAEMSPAEIEQKQRELEEFQQKKVAAKAVPAPLEPTPAVTAAEPPKPGPAKPVFRPKIKPAGPPPTT